VQIGWMTNGKRGVDVGEQTETQMQNQQTRLINCS
jgi:hypothetical protein